MAGFFQWSLDPKTYAVVTHVRRNPLLAKGKSLIFP